MWAYNNYKGAKFDIYVNESVDSEEGGGFMYQETLRRVRGSERTKLGIEIAGKERNEKQTGGREEARVWPSRYLKEGDEGPRIYVGKERKKKKRGIQSSSISSSWP